MPDTEHLVMRDIADGLLESADGVALGRVADLIGSRVIDADGATLDNPDEG